MLFVLADGWNLLLGSLAAASRRSGSKELAMDSQQVFTFGQQGLIPAARWSLRPVLLTVLVVASSPASSRRRRMMPRGDAVVRAEG